MTTKRNIFLSLILASVASAQTQPNLTAWGTNVTQSSSGAVGGYIRLSPITYNPYDSGTVCRDYGNNVVGQPLPVQGAAAFGPNDIVIWNTTSPSMPFTGGSGLVQNVLFTSPPTTGSGPCGIPLPVNGDYGVNTNGYFFGRGGLATDLPVYNSIQALQGGVTANSILGGVLYPTGAVTQCCGTLSAPAYLGGHVDIGHSLGPPSSALLTGAVTGGVTTTLTVNNALALGIGTQITFEDSSPEVVTVAASYTAGSLSVPLTVAPVSNHSSAAPIGWNSGTIAAVTNPFSGGEGLVQGQFYFDDTIGCPRMWYGLGSGWKCVDSGSSGTVPGLPAGSVQFNSTPSAGTFTGNAAFKFDPSIGNLSVCVTLGGICTATSGVDAQAFSSSATGTATAYTDAGGNFTIQGNGNSNWQNEYSNTSNPALLNAGSTGTVTTNGTTTVTWASGQKFQAFWGTGCPGAGLPQCAIVIASTTYTISSITDSTHLVTTATISTATSVYYFGGIVGQSVNGTFTITGLGNFDGQSYAMGNQSGAITGVSGEALLSATSTTLYVSLNGGSPVAISGGAGSCPSGSANDVLYTNGSACQGSSNLTWNNSTQVLTAIATGSSAASIYAESGFIQSDYGLVALGATAIAYNSIQAPGGGMQALSFTAAHYVQTGNASSAPSPTTSDTFHAGALFYNTSSACEQVYSGSTWGCIGSGGASTAPLIFTGLASDPAASAAGNANLYYNTTTLEFRASYAGSSYGGLKSPLFNCTATGSNLCVTQASGTFQIFGSGAAAFQETALGLLGSAATGTGGGTGVGNALLSATTTGLYLSLNGASPALVSYVPTWTHIPWNASDYSTLGGGTWSVTNPYVFDNSYTVVGKVMHWKFYVGGTTSGSPNVLTIKVPGGYTIGGTACSGCTGPYDVFPVTVADGTMVGGFLSNAGVTSGNTYITIAKLDLSNFPTFVYTSGDLTVEIQ